MGRLIPAGTGFAAYQKLGMIVDDEVAAADEAAPIPDQNRTVILTSGGVLYKRRRRNPWAVSENDPPCID